MVAVLEKGKGLLAAFRGSERTFDILPHSPLNIVDRVANYCDLEKFSKKIPQPTHARSKSAVCVGRIARICAPHASDRIFSN